MNWDELPADLRQSIIEHHATTTQGGVKKKRPRTKKGKAKETGIRDDRSKTPSLSDDDANSFRAPSTNGQENASESEPEGGSESDKKTLAVNGKRKQGDRGQGSQKRPKTQRMPAESTQRDESKKFEQLDPAKRGVYPHTFSLGL